MKSRGMFLALFSAVVLAAGCQRSEDESVIPPADAPMAESPAPIQEPMAQAPAPMPELPAAVGEQMVSGRISRVDPDARTVTVLSADGDFVFAFSEDTAVTGAAGTQGLAGSEGERVTVHYRQEADTNVAVRIDLLE